MSEGFFFNVYSQYLPGEIYGNEVKTSANLLDITLRYSQIY